MNISKKLIFFLVLITGVTYVLITQETKVYDDPNGKFSIIHNYERTFKPITFPGDSGCSSCAGQITVKNSSGNIIFQSEKNVIGLNRRPVYVFLKDKIYLRHYDIDSGFVKLLSSNGSEDDEISLKDFSDFYEYYRVGGSKRYGNNAYNITVKGKQMNDLNLKRTLVDFVERTNVVEDQFKLNKMIETHLSSSTKADIYFAIALGFLLKNDKEILVKNLKSSSTLKKLKYDHNLNEFYKSLAAKPNI